MSSVFEARSIILVADQAAAVIQEARRHPERIGKSALAGRDGIIGALSIRNQMPIDGPATGDAPSAPKVRNRFPVSAVSTSITAGVFEALFGSVTWHLDGGRGSDGAYVDQEEVMGRHAGWITAACGLASENGEPRTYPAVPGSAFRTRSDLVTRVEECIDQYGYCTVAVSEGLS
jgi:hypothetical protein